MNKPYDPFPEGTHFDDTSMWAGAEKKEDATVRLDFENGRIYFEGYTTCPHCGKNINEDQ